MANDQAARGSAEEQRGTTTSRSAGPASLSVSIPKTVRRERPPDNPEIRKEMKAIAAKRRRFWLSPDRRDAGARRIRYEPQEAVSPLHRGNAGCQTTTGRKRARGSRSPMPEALRPGERWSLDFLSDTFGASRRFRILAVNDDCCREKPLSDGRHIHIRRTRRAGTRCTCAALWQAASIVSDNGTEFTSRAILKWGKRQRRRLALHRSRQTAAECLHRVIQRQPAR